MYNDMDSTMSWAPVMYNARDVFNGQSRVTSQTYKQCFVMAIYTTSIFQRTTMIRLGIGFDKIQWIPFTIVYFNLKITEKWRKIRKN
jgi:hypothetical protein